MTTATKRTPEQIRDDRNTRRRTQRLANARFRMARHAAAELLSWSDWDEDRPVTTQQVINKTHAMYGNYRDLPTTRITEDEATAALTAVHHSA